METDITCVAKMRSSPTAKRAKNAYMLLKQKATKQNIAPINVETERSCKIQKHVIKQDESQVVEICFRNEKFLF